MDQKICLDCGSRLYGRSDKKFCNSQCRSNYHNRMKQEERMNIERTHSLLMNNRSILLKELKTDCSSLKISLTKLKSLGFKPEFHTGSSESKGRNVIHIYDYLVEKLDEDYVLICRNLKQAT